MQQMRELQEKTKLIIPRVSFQRLVREILQKHSRDLRMSIQALNAMQESAEIYLSSLFDDAFQLSLHAKRKTLMTKDLQLARRIRGEKALKRDK